MRLWHHDLIPYLPRTQLLSQWRELNSIYKKEDKHILINYIYSYNKEYLLSYSRKIIDEFQKRGYKINKWVNYENYFKGATTNYSLCYPQHNDTYLRICFYNLQEKCLAGQKDFPSETYEKIYNFCDDKGIFNEYN